MNNDQLNGRVMKAMQDRIGAVMTENAKLSVIVEAQAEQIKLLRNELAHNAAANTNEPEKAEEGVA